MPGKRNMAPPTTPPTTKYDHTNKSFQLQMKEKEEKMTLLGAAAAWCIENTKARKKRRRQAVARDLFEPLLKYEIQYRRRRRKRSERMILIVKERGVPVMKKSLRAKVKKVCVAMLGYHETHGLGAACTKLFESVNLSHRLYGSRIYRRAAATARAAPYGTVRYSYCSTPRADYLQYTTVH